MDQSLHSHSQNQRASGLSLEKDHAYHAWEVSTGEAIVKTQVWTLANPHSLSTFQICALPEPLQAFTLYCQASLADVALLWSPLVELRPAAIVDTRKNESFAVCLHLSPKLRSPKNTSIPCSLKILNTNPVKHTCICVAMYMTTWKKTAQTGSIHVFHCGFE